MSFGTLALVVLCGLAGPFVSTAARGAIPVVVGEIAAGVIIGRTGLRAIDTNNVTLAFLSDIGFAMLMLSVGMNIPLHERRLRAALGRGALAAALVAVLAVGAAQLVARIGGVGHPAVFAVLIASGSAAIVLPVIQERGLSGPAVLTVIAQVTVADIAATLAIPFVLRPTRAADVAAGTALIVACLFAMFVISRTARKTHPVRTLRRQGKRRRWAVDLRVSLLALFILAWIAQRTGASLLIAGFGAGLMIAAIGGPKRLSTEVLGIGGGFFVPLFFVVLGARIDLRGVVQHPALIALAFALLAATTLVHVLGARLTGQPAASGLVASAQLGVPSAVVALGLTEHVITSAEGAAVIAAASLSLVVCSVGATRMPSVNKRSRIEPATAVVSRRPAPRQEER